MIVRPTTVKSRPVFQWTRAAKTARRTKISTPTGQEIDIRELLGTTYKHGTFSRSEADFEVRVGDDGCLTVRRGRPTKTTVPVTHDRSKILPAAGRFSRVPS